MKCRIRGFAAAIIICLCLLVSAGCTETAPDTGQSEGQMRTVVDSRGVSVQVPETIERVVTIDDGIVLEVLTYLGEEDTLVGVGSRTYEEIDSYRYSTLTGDEYAYEGGMNTMTYLHPWVMELPVIAEYEGGVNYEGIVSLDPDVVIIELGSCTFWSNDENVQKALERIESLDIPLVVLKGTDFYDQPDISHLYEEVRTVGAVFGKENASEDLVDYLEGQVGLAVERTRDIPEEERLRVLYLGLADVARAEGGAGNTVSLLSFESWAIENLVHAKNAFREGTGYWHIISAETILAINPDVIILPTDYGYHPVRELYEAPYYQNLQELDAVKNKRVVSLPWTPYDCAKRLEYPIEVMVMAKAVYPERFTDIDLSVWVLDFYKSVYGVDDEAAAGLRTAQWLDWTVTDPI
jgi:iron complex transport system substrate-binding protein